MTPWRSHRSGAQRTPVRHDWTANDPPSLPGVFISHVAYDLHRASAEDSSGDHTSLFRRRDQSVAQTGSSEVVLDGITA